MMSLAELLLGEFDALQRKEGDVNEFVNQLVQKFDEWEAEHGLEGLSLREADATEAENSLAAILAQILDCSIVTPISKDTSESIEVVLQVIAGLAVRRNVVDVLLPRAVRGTTALLDAVRTHSCQFVGYLVSYPELVDDLVDQASQALLPRFTDKIQAVRSAAIQAAHAFFADNTDDPDLRQALLWSLQHDPSVMNRQAALASLPLTPQTVDHFLMRLRDTNVKLRVGALQRLQTYQDWTSDDMASLLVAGCTERCAATQQATQQVIGQWAKDCKYQPLELLKELNVSLYEDAAEILVKQLRDMPAKVLEDLDLTDGEVCAYHQSLHNAVVPLAEFQQEITLEQAFWIRCAGAAVLDQAMPDVEIFGQIVERHVLLLMKAVQEEDDIEVEQLTIKCLQLLQIKMVDMEEGSRRQYQGVLQRMLRSVLLPDDLVESAVLALQSTLRNDDDFCRKVVDIVETLTTDAVDDLKNHARVRTCTMLAVVLEHVASSTQVGNLQDYIVPAVTSDHDLVREAGVSCLGRLGLFCPCDVVAQDYYPLLSQVVQNVDEKEEVRAQAMLALSDWTTLFGAAHDDTTNVLEEWIDGSSVGLQCVAAEVMAKLLMVGKVHNPQWTGRLVASFFQVIAVDDDEEEAYGIDDVGNPVRLQQLLSVFFPSYCQRGGRATFVESVEHLLTYTTDKRHKPRGLKSWPIAKMLDFIVSTADIGRVEPKEGEADVSTAALLATVRVAKFLAANGVNVTTQRLLCKFMANSNIVLEKEQEEHLRELEESMEDLRDSISDSKCRKSLVVIQELLEQVDFEDVDEEDDVESLNEAVENLSMEKPTGKGRASVDGSVASSRRSLSSRN